MFFFSFKFFEILNSKNLIETKNANHEITALNLILAQKTVLKHLELPFSRNYFVPRNALQELTRLAPGSGDF